MSLKDNLLSCRSYIRQSKSPEAVKRLAEASDMVLHNAMEQSELCKHLGGLYVYTETGSENVDKFRGVRLTLIMVLKRCMLA